LGSTNAEDKEREEMTKSQILSLGYGDGRMFDLTDRDIIDLILDLKDKVTPKQWNDVLEKVEKRNSIRKK
jgi:hypothetical protein